VTLSKNRAFKLRFKISAEERDRLLAAFFTPAAADAEKSRFLSVYLDTPDADLLKQGLPWCFSRKDKSREGRIKAGEWRLDRESGARSFVKKHKLIDRIGGVFTMRLDRELLSYRAGEMAIDITMEQIALRSGDRSDEMIEVQFALRDGEADDLVRFVSGLLPQAVPVTAPPSHIERGYCLVGISHTPAPNSKALKLDGAMSVAAACQLIVQAEIGRCLSGPLPRDGQSVLQNIQAIRRLRSALHFLASAFNGEADTHAMAEWQAALEKAYDLDTALNVYLKPAAARGRWDCVGGLIARIEESLARAYAVLAQNWPEARVRGLFSAVADKLDASVSLAGSEALSVFLSRELTKAVDDIQAQGHRLEGLEGGKAKTDDLRRLAEAVERLQDVTGFFEPLASGKSASKRWLALRGALGDLEALPGKEYHLAYAQTLIADAAAHMGRMKQTKTQIAQIYAAGALAGFLEALKEEAPDKTLKNALETLFSVKPFWDKLD